MIPWMLWLPLACTTDGPVDSTPPEPSTPLVCEGDGAAAAITIAPYVQLVGTESAWVLWETDVGAESTVHFGLTESVESTVCGELVPLIAGGSTEGLTRVHEAQLTDLVPDTAYFYQVETEGELSDVHRFRTVPLADSEARFQIVALGDSQQDSQHPDMFTQIINNGVIPVARSRYGEDLDTSLAMVLFAGDLVDNGWIQDEWQSQFFGPAAALFAQVPVYPVLGNHEANTPHYFRYFHLPEDEHHYTVDHTNLRVIALDSNDGFRTEAQLAWLDEVLAQTCADPAIDFVFAQLHHPWLSELWTPGEEDWSGQVVQRLTAFSTACSKPSIHFFGHTHGYSRGASKEHEHLMVNVSSAGGALDRWGEQPQVDYPEFAVSQDHYGFVIVEVIPGADASFELLRFSQGTPESPLHNELTDRFTVRKNNAAPSAPSATESTCSGSLFGRGSAFLDGDGDAHQASQWQVATSCSDWSAPLVDRWLQRRNEYGGLDTQIGDDLTDEGFVEVSEGLVCVRVRYRDDGLVWSEWSAGTEVACTL